MKLLITGSPKTGNVWLERLLANIYGMPILDLSGTSFTEPPAISENEYVTHQHYMPTKEILEWGDMEGVQFLTMTRHPGDIFVSLYHYVNNFAPLWEKEGWLGNSWSHIMIGEAIDSPKCLEYMEKYFKQSLANSVEWAKSEASIMVKYEDLSRDALQTLTGVTSQLVPVKEKIIKKAIKTCDIKRMKRENKLMNLHCRSGKAGKWKKELSEPHINILRQTYAEEMAIFGYSAV